MIAKGGFIRLFITFDWDNEKYHFPGGVCTIIMDITLYQAQVVW